MGLKLRTTRSTASLSAWSFRWPIGYVSNWTLPLGKAGRALTHVFERKSATLIMPSTSKPRPAYS